MVKDGYKFVLPLLLRGDCRGGSRLEEFPAAVLLFVCAGVAFFFRDPERLPPAEPGVVVSPADGRITEDIGGDFRGLSGAADQHLFIDLGMFM